MNAHERWWIWSRCGIALQVHVSITPIKRDFPTSRYRVFMEGSSLSHLSPSPRHKPAPHPRGGLHTLSWIRLAWCPNRIPHRSRRPADPCKLLLHGLPSIAKQSLTLVSSLGAFRNSMHAMFYDIPRQKWPKISIVVAGLYGRHDARKRQQCATAAL